MLSGDVVSMEVPTLSLSEGWRKEKKKKIEIKVNSAIM
jgi:hypothetical protein